MSRQARIAADQGMLTARNCGGLYKIKKSCWVTQKDKHVISNSSFLIFFFFCSPLSLHEAHWVINDVDVALCGESGMGLGVNE